MAEKKEESALSRFNTLLAEVQRELKAPKGQYNKFGKYMYRSCEDILEAVKPLLHERGLTLTLTDEIVYIDSAIDPRYYVKARATVTDGENQEYTYAYAREDLVKKGMDGSQITGTASSYARKYALNGLFLIDDTKDADTDENKRVQQAAQSDSAAPKDAPKASTPPKAETAPPDAPVQSEGRPLTVDEAKIAFKGAFIHFRDSLHIADKEERTEEARRLLTEAVGPVSYENGSATELSRAADWLNKQVM